MKFFEYQENCSEAKPGINLDLIQSKKDVDRNKILCRHCKRTLDNGIRCLGICVADNDY